MGTNSTIRFTRTNSSPNVHLYSHYDGYLSGMAGKLDAAFKYYRKHIGFKPETCIRNSKFINAFIAANLNNIDIEESTSIREFVYDIDLERNTIQWTYNPYNGKFDSGRATINEFLCNHDYKYTYDAVYGVLSEKIINAHIDNIQSDNMRICLQHDMELYMSRLMANQDEINRLLDLIEELKNV